MFTREKEDCFCSFCPYTTKRTRVCHMIEHVLAKHMDVAHFPCALCEERFKTTRLRRKHYQTVHNRYLSIKQIRSLKPKNPLL